MKVSILMSLLLPLFISAILFMSWKRNENKNPKMSRLAFIFAIIFVAIAICLAVLWFVFV